MNPLNWKTEHKIGFFFAAAFGACIGVFAGVGKVNPYAGSYWLLVAEWGAAGALLGAAGGFLRQMLRGKDSN